MPDLAALLREALGLGVDERAILAEKLLASLDELNEEEAELLWAAEARTRLSEYRAGRARAVDSAEVAGKAESLLR